MKPESSNPKRQTVLLSRIFGERQDEDAGGHFQRGLLISLFIIISILLAFTGCEAPVVDLSVHHFVIRDGERYASPRVFERFDSKTLAFTARFDESAMYNIDDAGLESDKNILMGFTDCGSLHAENSADFTWQWVDARLKLYAHCYANGVPKEQYIGLVSLNKENRYEISVSEGQYVFYVNDEQKAAFERLSQCDEENNYILFPYFGEPIPAPHNIRLEIRMLD